MTSLPAQSGIHDESISSSIVAKFKRSGGELLVDWIADHYKDFGARLEIVSNHSTEGIQFVKGFNGIGGILHYRVDMSASNEDEDELFSDDDE